MKKWLLICLSLWVLVIAPWAIGSTQANEEIVLGVATSLGLLEGEESLRAARLAVAEINRKGGVPVGEGMRLVRVVEADLQDAMPGVSVNHALSLLERVIVEKRPTAIVVGPFRSEVLLPAMDLMAKYEVLMLGTLAMSPASEVKVIREPRYRYVFRVCLNSRYLVSYLIDTMKLLHAKFGLHKVFMMVQDVAWARTTASLISKYYFRRAGWEIQGLESYPNGCENYVSGLKRAREQGAQVILPIFDMPESGTLVKQWKAMKVPALMVGFISPLAGPSAWRIFDKDIVGAINCNFEFGSAIASQKVPKSIEFYNTYEKTFGKPMEAGHGPAPAYESVHILAEAIERSRSLIPEYIVPALEKTDRMGVMGRIRFNRGHQTIFGTDPHKEALACLFQWTEDGKRRIVHPPSISEGEILLPQGVVGVKGN